MADDPRDVRDSSSTHAVNQVNNFGGARGDPDSDVEFAAADAHAPPDWIGKWESMREAIILAVLRVRLVSKKDRRRAAMQSDMSFDGPRMPRPAAKRGMLPSCVPSAVAFYRARRWQMHTARHRRARLPQGDARNSGR